MIKFKEVFFYITSEFGVETGLKVSLYYDAQN